MKAARARSNFGLLMCRYYFLRPFCFPPFLVRYIRAEKELRLKTQHIYYETY